MSDVTIEALAKQGKLIKNASLADYNSWRTGGVADYLYQPKDLQDLSNFISQVPDSMSITWLGLGSNSLIRDGGIRGVVILTLGGLNQLTTLAQGMIRAEAGVSSAQLARFSARQSLAGLEFMAGIPGTVGGALAMNAGCFDGETWKYVTAVETIDRKGVLRLREPDDYQVSYRHVSGPQGEWFVAGHFTLQSGDKAESLEKIKALLERRNATQPTGTANCGSVFRNPPNDYAGRLIESCGLKGFTVGGASVSDKHANFIVNGTKAKSADIEQLIYSVKDSVQKITGVDLQPEVHIIGQES